MRVGTSCGPVGSHPDPTGPRARPAGPGFACCALASAYSAPGCKGARSKGKEEEGGREHTQAAAAAAAAAAAQPRSRAAPAAASLHSQGVCVLCDTPIGDGGSGPEPGSSGRRLARPACASPPPSPFPALPRVINSGPLLLLLLPRWQRVCPLARAAPAWPRRPSLARPVLCARLWCSSKCKGAEKGRKEGRKEGNEASIGREREGGELKPAWKRRRRRRRKKKSGKERAAWPLPSFLLLLPPPSPFDSLMPLVRGSLA